MIRRHENQLAFKAGALSLLVHALFFVLLFMSFNWKTVPPLQVSDVELWDTLPAPAIVTKPEPKPEPPKPVAEPKPEPPAPPSEPKAEIAVEKPKSKPPQKPKPEPKQKAAEEAKKREEELKRIQKLLDAEEKLVLQERQQREAQQLNDARAAQNASQMRGALNEYLGQISSKIRQRVNPQICGSGKPVLIFEISLMPTGELLSPPRLKKGSGIAACDAAVERAILQAQPLPLPSDPDLIARLRDLVLEFRPNE
jgi:colicin import membrane protein